MLLLCIVTCKRCFAVVLSFCFLLPWLSGSTGQKAVVPDRTGVKQKNGQVWVKFGEPRPNLIQLSTEALAVAKFFQRVLSVQDPVHWKQQGLGVQQQQTRSQKGSCEA